MNDPVITRFALLAPKIPSTEANGGLNWTDLYGDPEASIVVQVLLPPGNEIGLNDRIDLYWEHKPLLSTIVDDTALATRFVTFMVKAVEIINFADGQHAVNYVVTSAIGGAEDQSPDLLVRVKTSRPGGVDPDSGTPYINENLPLLQGIPEIIDDQTQSLTVTVPAYENMDADDTVTLAWGGQRLSPSAAVEPNKAVTFTVTRKQLEDSAGEVIVRYQIRDRVNNWSKFSLQTDTDVEVGDSFLQAPRVHGDGVVNGQVDLERLGDKDLGVMVPAYQFDNGTSAYVVVTPLSDAPRLFIEIGDEVQLIWSGFTAEGTALTELKFNHTVVEGDIGWTLSFSIPNPQVRLIASGYATIRYSATSVGGTVRQSRRANVPVIGDVQRLPAPVVLEATGTVLDPETLPGTGATLRIAATELIAAGDTILLTWNGTTAQGAPLVETFEIFVTGNMPGTPIDRVVGRAFIDPLVNGQVEISYTLTKVDRPVSQSPITRLQVRSASSRLPAPVVDYAEGNLLDPDKVPVNGTMMRVNYTPMLPGELVTVHWAGVPAYTDNLIIPANWNGREIPFQLAKSYVQANLGKTVQVYYTVELDGSTRTSASLELNIRPAGPSELVDDFTEHNAYLIGSGQSINTQYTRIQFVSGAGQVGFPQIDELTPEVDQEMFVLPVLHVSRGDIGNQTILIELDTECLSLTFNVHGVIANAVTVRYLDVDRGELEVRQLPAVLNQQISYASTGSRIKYLEITSRSDWTLWDRFVLEV